jgi:hypothetical protein
MDTSHEKNLRLKVSWKCTFRGLWGFGKKRDWFYVPLAYILHLLDSCRFSKRICLLGDLEFSGIVCN